jgi:hypothetical protein
MISLAVFLAQYPGLMFSSCAHLARPFVDSPFVPTGNLPA